VGWPFYRQLSWLLLLLYYITWTTYTQTVICWEYCSITESFGAFSFIIALPTTFPTGEEKKELLGSAI
jgi:hypothetical protein